MLWAITCYFNPVSYQTKKHNYDLFRFHLNVPLLTVELGYSDFELSKTDADILLQVHDGAILWQKERLLNIALQALPAECSAVAWLDADIIFEEVDWAEQTLRALESHVFVQPFESLLQLQQDQSFADRQGRTPQRVSVSSAYVRAQIPEDYFKTSGASCRTGLTPGVAWAGRRDCLEHFGFYDAMILGGGDRAILNAMTGHSEDFVQIYGLSPEHAAHYRAWAEPFYQQVQGRIGYVPGQLTHFWHGSTSDRQYQQRRKILPAFGFDPNTDIQHQPGQAWHWASDKPQLQAAVADYFKTRREDGA